MTCLEAVEGGGGGAGALLSASADRTLALWDLRRLGGATAAAAAPGAPLAVFLGHKARREGAVLRCARLLRCWR